MKSFISSFSKRFLGHPIVRYQIWTWIAVLAAILTSMVVTWLHFEQQKVLRQMVDTIMTMHLARIELSKGFLYATLSTDPAAPFNREEGIALLQQAANSLEAAANVAGDAAPGYDEVKFQQSLDAFRARLVEFGAATTPQPGLVASLRIAFHDLESHADVIDRQNQRKIQELGSRFDLEFNLTLAGASVLMLGLCSLMIYTGRAKEKSDAVLLEREHKLQKLLDILPVGVSILDADGRVVFSNPSLQSILQMTAEGIASGAYKQRTYFTSDGSAVRFASTQARESGAPVYDVETGIVKEDGETIWTSVSAVPVGFPDWRMLIVTSDITERKKAEQKLRESEARYRLIAENTADVIWVLDPLAGKFTYISPSVEKLRGYTPDEVLAQPLYETLTPESVKMVSESLAANLPVFIAKGSGTASFVNEVDQPCKDGRIVHTEVTTTYLFNEHGGVEIIGVSRDITERKEIENRLKESERQYRGLVQAANSAIIRWKSTGEITFFNEYAQGLFGYRPEEIIGRPVNMLVPAKDSTGDDLSTLVQNIVDHPDQFVNVVNENICRDGRRVWMAWTNKVIHTENDQVSEILAVGIDITQRRLADEQLRASEAKFKAVFDNAPVGISLLDEKRNLLESNDMLEQIVRMNEAKLVAGAYRGRKYIREDGSEIPTSELASTRAIVERRAIRDVVNGIVMEDGEIIWTQVSAAPLGISDPRFVVITQDITARKRAVDELRRSNAELEQFAYVASHDLQEPLRTVAGMVQLLQQRYRGQLDARADEYIHYAVDASDRMQKLISDLLDFSRIERRGRPFEATEMEKVLKAALFNLKTAIAESQAQISSDPLPVVQADAGQLIQVLQNLISNAIKFRSQQPPQIHISAEKIDNAWRFAVQDNGIGIDPQYFERVFLLFQRLHTRRKYPGTGIGLALCKKIIERHGGQMWIQSELEHGATFFFTIPERS